MCIRDSLRVRALWWRCPLDEYDVRHFSRQPLQQCLVEVLPSVIRPNDTEKDETKVHVKCHGFLVIIPAIAASQHVLCVCVFPQLRADISTVTHAFSDGLSSPHSGDIALNRTTASHTCLLLRCHGIPPFTEALLPPLRRPLVDAV